MANIDRASWQFYIMLGTVAAQFLGLVYFLGSQAEAFKSEVTSIKVELKALDKQVNKLDSDRTTMLQLIKEVALLQAKDSEIERRINETRIK